jgi:5-formyltetrahydrofolate cyclo-ligase
MSSIQSQKESLRSQLKCSRREIPDSSRAKNNEVIQQRLFSLEAIQTAKSVFCFISYGTEVHTHAIIDELLAQGKLISVPRIIESGQMIALKFNNWDELEPGQLGILTPPENEAAQHKYDVVITPGLGFTEKGKRLGFGRGYYDKWFQDNDFGLKVALAYECQIIDDLPTDENDKNVDIIISETRTIEITNQT